MDNPMDHCELLSPGDSLVFIDGGARNGPSDLRNLQPFCITHCFEPNPHETAPLQELAEMAVARKDGRNQLFVHPVALAESSGTCTLNISRRPGATSCLRPNAALLREFPADHWSEMQDIVESIDVPCVSLADFLDEFGVQFVDFCKLDTQGTELEILRGAGPRIQDFSVVKLEVNFLPIYEDQPRVSEIFGFLEDQGFVFVDLTWSHSCRRFHVDPKLPPSAYRLVWADALFMRTLPSGHPRLVQQGLVLGSLGYLDPALHVLTGTSGAASTRARQFIRGLAEPKGSRNRIRRQVERMAGVVLSRYPWRAGKQVPSRRVGSDA